MIDERFSFPAPDFDAYITKEPEDNFTPWIESLYDQMDEKITTEMDDLGFNETTTENNWLNDLFDQGMEPEQATPVMAIVFNNWKKVQAQIQEAETRLDLLKSDQIRQKDDQAEWLKEKIQLETIITTLTEMNK